jgi:hypothetical protein
VASLPCKFGGENFEKGDIMVKAAAFSLLMAIAAACNTVLAAPVTYSFATSTVSSIGSGPSGSTLAGLLSGLSVSGTFTYDSTASATGTLGDGETLYGGPSSPNYLLSGTVGTYSFSDPRGNMGVGNDKPIAPFPSADIVQIDADPGNPAVPVHNISGFGLDGFSLYNVRMFWISGQTTPELIPDFLTNQDLPTVLPAFHGRLALDFVEAGTTGPQSSVFFDGLAVAPEVTVPEPGTCALLSVGLGLLGLTARRRKLGIAT